MTAPLQLRIPACLARSYSDYGRIFPARLSLQSVNLQFAVRRRVAVECGKHFSFAQTSEFHLKGPEALASLVAVFRFVLSKHSKPTAILATAAVAYSLMVIDRWKRCEIKEGGD